MSDIEVCIETITPNPHPQSAEPIDAAIESQLSDEITSLWSEHTQVAATKKTTAKELRAIRAKLAERLHAMKDVLCRPGRDGEWRGWLRERGIPRSTADRLVARHAESLASTAANLPSEATSSPDDDIDRLIDAILPRLRRVLTSEAAVLQFILRLASTLDLKIDARNVGELILTTHELDGPSLAPGALAEALADDIGYCFDDLEIANVAAATNTPELPDAVATATMTEQVAVTADETLAAAAGDATADLPL